MISSLNKASEFNASVSTLGLILRGSPRELHRRHQLASEKLANYQAMKAVYKAITDPPKTEQFRYLTLRRGMCYEQDWIDWCDEVLDFLKAGAQP